MEKKKMGRPKTGEYDDPIKLLLPKGWKKQLMLIGYKQSIDKDKIVPLQEVIRSALKEKYNLK